MPCELDIPDIEGNKQKFARNILISIGLTDIIMVLLVCRKLICEIFSLVRKV